MLRRARSTFLLPRSTLIDLGLRPFDLNLCCIELDLRCFDLGLRRLELDLRCFDLGLPPFDLGLCRIELNLHCFDRALRRFGRGLCDTHLYPRCGDHHLRNGDCSRMVLSMATPPIPWRMVPILCHLKKERDKATEAGISRAGSLRPPATSERALSHCSRCRGRCLPRPSAWVRAGRDPR